jgi:probable FeS assembly SUF system protein SufT
MDNFEDKAREALANPQNVGEMEDADAVGTAGSADCGDMLRMWLKFSEKDGKKVIDRASFQSFGCQTAIAVASMATELLKGKSIEEARTLSIAANWWKAPCKARSREGTQLPRLKPPGVQQPSPTRWPNNPRVASRLSPWTTRGKGLPPSESLLSNPKSPSPMNEEITLTREVEAIQIPSGDTITLPTGTPVVITQSLGGTYTVATSSGLARISSTDSDALGIDTDEKEAKTKEVERLKDAPIEEQVWHQLKQVYDPEIPVDIVNLGLVYDCTVADEDGKNIVTVKMTLTAPGCGMGPAIAADAQSRIMTVDQIDDARVELVWDPPWNQEMISEEGKMKLGMV